MSFYANFWSRNDERFRTLRSSFCVLFFVLSGRSLTFCLFLKKIQRFLWSESVFFIELLPTGSERKTLRVSKGEEKVLKAKTSANQPKWAKWAKWANREMRKWEKMNEKWEKVSLANEKREPKEIQALAIASNWFVRDSYAAIAQKFWAIATAEI